MVQRESGRAGCRETLARFKHVAASVSINHGGKTRQRRQRWAPWNGRLRRASRASLTLIALISSRRSHQLFCAIKRLPPRCREAVAAGQREEMLVINFHLNE